MLSPSPLLFLGSLLTNRRVRLYAEMLPGRRLVEKAIGFQTAPDLTKYEEPVRSNRDPANLGQLKYVFSFDLAGWAPGADTDGDGLFDNLETSIGSDINSSDTDGNGLSDQTEYLAGYDPAVDTSADADQLPDDWENYYGLDTTTGTNSSSNDSDGDFLTDYQEFYAGTNPTYTNAIDEDSLGLINLVVFNRGY